MAHEAPAPGGPAREDGAVWLEVGRVERPHGLRGEVLVRLVSDHPARLRPGSVLRAGGRMLTVGAARPHQQRWLVVLEGVGTREEADALRGVTLEAEPLDDPEDPGALWVHELVGATVVDRSGRVRGEVEALQANPASDLLVLRDGALVPLVFVDGWDDDGRLVIDPPLGLLDDEPDDVPGTGPAGSDRG
ncbi:MAG: ribosome maturation factor RimM [Acidimicrobiales bacterium]|jgi:16S rRNA processing protein RimM|nr:ribosome maturation factor RimM [Acidimicrobiales bacterium]